MTAFYTQVGDAFAFYRRREGSKPSGPQPILTLLHGVALSRLQKLRKVPYVRLWPVTQKCYGVPQWLARGQEVSGTGWQRGNLVYQYDHHVDPVALPRASDVKCRKTSPKPSGDGWRSFPLVISNSVRVLVPLGVSAKSTRGRCKLYFRGAWVWWPASHQKMRDLRWRVHGSTTTKRFRYQTVGIR